MSTIDELIISRELFKAVGMLCKNTIAVIPVDYEVDNLKYRNRLVESSFILTNEIKKSRRLITAHNLEEYRVTPVTLNSLMKENEELLFDKIVEVYRGNYDF